ncbi:MAG: restriction endonuclease subunit S [Natronincolaceae bacterium]|jgi:type I restriction enzyme S subunit
MSRWREVRLEDKIKTLKGFAFKSSFYKDKGVPVVRVSDFTEWKISKENIVYVDPKDEYEGFKLKEMDILCQTVGSWLNNPKSIVGKIVRVPKYLNNSYLNQNIVKIIPKKKISNNFLFYRLKADDFKYYCVNSAQGAANQASITLETIRKFKFQIPDPETQEKIADILSTYDELIENNNRRIEILEKTAEEIYKEWFVRMRFPGHENTRFEKGIPEGWEVRKIGDVINKLESGKRPKNNFQEEKMIVSLGAGDIKNLGEYSNNGEYLIPYSFFKELNKGKVESKDIAVYKDGAYTGRVTMFRDDFPYKEIAINEHVFLVRCKNKTVQNYLLFTLKQKSYFELIQILSMTSAQPGINQSKFKNIKIEIPDSKLIKKFDNIAETCLKEIFNLAKQNQNLIKQRDLLLPRLMNGTIEVK